VLTQLRHLSGAIAVMDPTADRSLLKLALSRLTPGTRPVRDKRGRLVSPLVLLRLGQKLMAKWQSRPAHDPRLNAMDYRDGFMIALLALCPLRLENLAAVVIGQHLTLASERPRLAFTADEMKGRRSLEFDVPTALHVKLAFYLTDIHPMLYRGPQLGAPLWPSLHTDKPKMSEHGIYTRITQVTEKHLGHPISPHMFRDAAATFITELVPEHAHDGCQRLAACQFGRHHAPLCARPAASGGTQIPCGHRSHDRPRGCRAGRPLGGAPCEQ